MVRLKWGAFQSHRLFLFNQRSGQATRRHPEYPPYCCFFSDLTGFEGFRRAGPTRSAASIPHQYTPVNVLISTLS
jgi:hypothetical protein